MSKKIKTGIKYNAVYGYMEKNGKYYEPLLDETTGEVILKDNTKQFKKRESICKEITNKIRNRLDKDKVLMEALMKLDNKELKLLIKELKTKKVRPKTRAHRCVDMKIGKLILPIIN